MINRGPLKRTLFIIDEETMPIAIYVRGAWAKPNGEWKVDLADRGSYCRALL